MELRQKGVPEHIVETHIGTISSWEKQIEQVRQKKFGPILPSSPQEKAKQWRYLQYKGYTSEQIGSLFKE
jgi:regulatory protein